ncbi:hypothetical protein DPMN_157952 [Dreissena polymorpha]|uniref:G-protein coupled receptors family 1 profile domain-containing protein n=1 Tax=Dreissena polymorpha TaxID=45954 RepID=A0A9D4IPB7_DREPO|nr:hypothetical protein DPMN_157952 [Dreissena polymorpha]
MDYETMQMNSSLIEQLNRERVLAYLPVLVFVVTACLVGTISNGMAFVFYKRQAKKSKSTTNLIFAILSFADLFTCMILFSTTAPIFYSYTFNNALACKIIMYASNAWVATSFLVIFLLGVDRFLTVYMPITNWKLTSKSAILSAVGILLFSSGMCVPDFMTAEITRFDVRVNDNVTLAAEQCVNADPGKNKHLKKFFSMIKVAIVSIVCLCLIVMYILIAKKVKALKPNQDTGLNHGENAKHAHDLQFTDEYTSSGFIDKSVDICATAVGSCQRSPSIQTARIVRATKSNASSACSCFSSQTSVKSRMSARTVRSTITNLTSRNRMLKRRITLMVFLMVMVSIISLFPNTIIKMSSLQRHEYPMWMTLLYHTYVLNNCANAFIIGYCNSAFRAYVKSLMCKTRIA